MRTGGTGTHAAMCHGKALQGRLVWLVSSGPLDDSARAGDLPAVAHVRQLGARVRAQGTVTFGGRLQRDAKGFPAKAMAKTRAGDWRDPDQVREFAALVASQLARTGEIPT